VVNVGVDGWATVVAKPGDPELAKVTARLLPLAVIHHTGAGANHAAVPTVCPAYPCLPATTPLPPRGAKLFLSIGYQSGPPFTGPPMRR